jgi:hypothetical protein
MKSHDPDGYVAAMRALHRSVAEDIRAQRGFITRAKTLYAYRSSWVQLVNPKLQAVLRFTRRRA